MTEIRSYIAGLARLAEARRDPAPRETAVAFLRQYKDNPHAYLHTTSVHKVGVYPKSRSGHDSPVGVYAFRLQDIWDEHIEYWNSNGRNDGLFGLPYNGGPHLFVLESDIDTNFPEHYSEDDLAADIAKLQDLYGLDDTGIKRLRRAARTNLNFRDMPAGYFWGMTKALAGGVSEFDTATYIDTKRWNAILRRLGYVGFNDPGHGVIHGAEPAQAVFLTTTAFRVVDHMLANRQQQIVQIGDDTYKGGRLPRDLVMRTVPDTLFYNYEPEHFAKVRTWTVSQMEYGDLHRFARFVPWNGRGTVETLVIPNRDYVTFSTDVRKFFEQKVPPNVTVKTLLVMARDAVYLLRSMPETFPVERIVLSPWAYTTGLDNLPAGVRAKIEVQPR